MLGIDQEVAAVAQPRPSAERLRALRKIIPCSLIKSILKQTGQNRLCRCLPKYLMVWFVIAMGLCATDCYRQIYRWLHHFRPKGVPPRSSLCEARQRLGVAPLRLLMHRVVQLLATALTPGAYYRGLRLMAVDGFVVDLPDTRDNARVFGRPKGGRTPGAFPQARVLALCEIGTHVIGKHLIKPIRRGEVTMAAYLLRFLDKDMLLLWDRNFLSYANLAQVRQREAHLLARIKSNMIFQPIRRFWDGSFLAKAYPSAHCREKDRDGILVRIIEYTFKDPGRP